MIFWKYIKGLTQGGAIHETGTSTNATRYTYIEFQPENTVSGTFTNSPWIYFNNGEGTQNTPLGHIITQKATGQYIETEFTFNNNIYLADTKAIYLDGLSASSFLYNNSASACYLHSNKTLYLDAGSTDYNIFFRQGGTTRAFLNSIGLGVTGDVVASGKCEAIYFNATSDKRAKTNLKPLEINALDLINRVQLYSFKYKDSDLPSIGILAQDVQDVNIEGFDLVDNKQASGVDMDYMSIHESKLTYILWKAIQEQQKEIEELKTQIKNLTK